MESPDNSNIKDVKNLPHYTVFKIQPIEFFRANKGILDFLQMCAIKYICRYPFKNGKEDLLKARNYIDMMIEDWDKEHPPEFNRVLPTPDDHVLCGYCTRSTFQLFPPQPATHTCDDHAGRHFLDEPAPHYRCRAHMYDCCNPLNR